jgi:hypothetical protein
MSSTAWQGAFRFHIRLAAIAKHYGVTFDERMSCRTSRPSPNSYSNDAVDGACSAASKCHRLVASKPERFNEVRPGNDDGVPKFWRNWRGHDDVMQIRSIRGSGEPVWVIALLKCALTIGTRSAQSIMASGFTAAQTGRTHDRTRPMLHKRQKVLAKAAPSTHDPTCADSGAQGDSSVNSPCGKLDGYGGWWFWRRRHHQLGSYLGRIPSALA